MATCVVIIIANVLYSNYRKQKAILGFSPTFKTLLDFHQPVKRGKQDIYDWKTTDKCYIEKVQNAIAASTRLHKNQISELDEALYDRSADETQLAVLVINQSHNEAHDGGQQLLHGKSQEQGSLIADDSITTPISIPGEVKLKFQSMFNRFACLI